MKFLAKDYNNRTDLLDDIKAKVGDNMEKNIEAVHLIEGTREELFNLHLSDVNRVYGIRCVILDTPITDKKNKGQKMSKLRMLQ